MFNKGEFCFLLEFGNGISGSLHFGCYPCPSGGVKSLKDVGRLWTEHIPVRIVLINFNMKDMDI